MLLAGVRVVELDGGPGVAFCARIFAGLGAEVLLVEPPGGSRLRRAGPFVGGAPDPETSGLFLYLHAGTRSLTLDPTTATGRRLLRRLLAGADVFLHGLRPSEAAALRLEPDALAGAFPRLVVTAITPFGLTGPRADDLGGDLTAFHGGGYGSITTRAVTDPARQPPLRGPGRQAEYLGGLAAVAGTLAALPVRDHTGCGGLVDLSLEDTIVTAIVSELRAYTDGKRTWDRRASDSLAGGVVIVLPCADGLIAVSPREEHQWQRWLDLMGRPAWADDPRYATRAGRAAHWREIEPLLAAFTRTRAKDGLAVEAQARRVAAFPVSTVADLLADPQLGPSGRAFFQEVVQPVAGPVRLPSAPYQFSATPWVDRPAPLLGEANAEVYRSRLGLSGQRMAVLRAAEVL